MLNAIIDGQISAPIKKGRATCPLCSGRVIAKCGTRVTHHWAHEATTDCDPWSEPEGEWHRAWKSLVRPEQREVTMGPHRADIVSASGQVIELQHSSISAEDIAERCAFYHPMIWVFDVSKAVLLDATNLFYLTDVFRQQLGRIGRIDFDLIQYQRVEGQTIAGIFCLLLLRRVRLDWAYALRAGERVLLDCGRDVGLLEVLRYTEPSHRPGDRYAVTPRVVARVVHRRSFVEWMRTAGPEMPDDELRGADDVRKGRAIRR